MGYTSTEHQLQYLADPPPDQLTVASGSWFEVLCGTLGLAVAVVGLAGNQPLLMAATATVILGFGVFARAGTIAARANRCSQGHEILGVSADLVAGLAGVALGALVLLHLVPFTWIPIASVALGGGLVFTARIDLDKRTSKLTVWSQTVMLATGLAAMAFALFALAAVGPTTTLSLIAVACVGCGLVAAGKGTPLHRTSTDTL